LTKAANESVLEAARHVEQLGESARSIDAVVNLIKQIASQTTCNVRSPRVSLSWQIPPMASCTTSSGC
jgi:hypothetical protein